MSRRWNFKPGSVGGGAFGGITSYMFGPGPPKRPKTLNLSGLKRGRPRKRAITLAPVEALKEPKP